MQVSLDNPKDVHGLSNVRDLGDMVISAGYVHEYCVREGVDENTHWKTIVAHGISHLLGYDHETDSDFELMDVKERALLEKLHDFTAAVVPRTRSTEHQS